MSGGQETRVTKVSALEQQLLGAGSSCLVVIYGPDLGHRYELTDPEFTIGRDIGNQITVDLDNISRRHARLTQRDGKVFLADLGSTNGTFLNDEEIRGEVPLRSGDLVKIGGAIFKFLYGGNVESLFHEEIYRITIGDGLTQCYNKRYFVEFLEREMARAQRYGRPLSLTMFDIDHFKQVNDGHGHLAGDHVLRELATIIRTKVRKEECFARFGGEEFALVSPESGPARVRKFAEKLRQLVQAHDFSFDGKHIPVTLSAGVADMTPSITEPAQFIKAADLNLYAAKNQGRNCVVG
ncbi:MAG: diguanylate cyclase [Deltaproteobacteria bacterium]